MSELSVQQKLLRLVADERFARLEILATRPNLFKLVGRTHTETWHSMFLGWLLDPSGSHGLRDFALKRLLLAITNPTLQALSTTDLDRVAKIAALGELSSASVIPNEHTQQEYKCSVGRLDIFITGIKCEGEPDTVILLEQKVGAPINKLQCRKYADWLAKRYADKFQILVMLAPEDRLGATPDDTFGDYRWNAIDYQRLHDVVLVPALRCPTLREQFVLLIEQYIDALRIPINGRKLAVTDEEKELALELYEKHKEAFEAISSALSSEVGVNLIPSEPEKTALELKVDGQLVSGKNVSDFFHSLMKFIDSSAIKIESELPYATSNKRYLIAKDPHHQAGNPFWLPVEYEGLYMEAHKSWAQALKDAARFLKKLGCNVEVTN